MNKWEKWKRGDKITKKYHCKKEKKNEQKKYKEFFFYYTKTLFY